MPKEMYMKNEARALRDKAVVAEYKADPSQPLSSIGRQFNLSGGSVANILETAGVREKGKRSNKGRLRVNVDIYKVMELYYEQGYPLEQVGKKLGVSHETIRGRLRAEGLPTSRRAGVYHKPVRREVQEVRPLPKESKQVKGIFTRIIEALTPPWWGRRQ